MLAHERHAPLPIVERSQKLRNHRQTKIAINRNVSVKKLSNVDGNVFNPGGTNLHRADKAIDDLELSSATDCACHAALGNCFDTETPGGFIRDHRHPRSGIEHETQ